MNHTTPYPRPLLLLPFLVSLLFLAMAAQSIAGQAAATLQQDGQSLRLEVSVPSPPPTSLIASIKLPAQTKIGATSPPAAKVDSKKAHIKWLVKHPRPGTLRFSVTTSPPIKLSSVSAEVLFRPPGGGSLTRIEAKKR